MVAGSFWAKKSPDFVINRGGENGKSGKRLAKEQSCVAHYADNGSLGQPCVEYKQVLCLLAAWYLCHGTLYAKVPCAAGFHIGALVYVALCIQLVGVHLLPPVYLAVGALVCFGIWFGKVGTVYRCRGLFFYLLHRKKIMKRPHALQQVVG